MEQMNDEKNEKKEVEKQQNNFVLAVLFGLLIFAGIFYLARKDTKPTDVSIASIPPATIHTPGVNEYNSDGTIKDTTSAVPLPDEHKSSWNYEKSEDKMGNISKRAFVKSDDLIFFDSPYGGGSTAFLVVRKTGSNLDIYVTVEPSQMSLYSGYDGRNVINVRFDEEKTVKWKYNEAADNSSNILFINSTSRFLDKLKKSKKVVIEILFYEQGTRQIEFNTKDLKF